jgi:IgGFc binding protein
MIAQTQTPSTQTLRPQDKMRETVRATSEGRDFWVCFQKNGLEPERDERTGRISQREQLFLELFITSSEDTKVTIEIEGLLFRQETRIRGGTVVNIKIDTAAQLRSSEVPERLAVHITSEKTVSVYGLSHRYQTTDTFMGLPVEALGTEYRTVNYYKLREDLISQLAVIATEDNTSVTITPNSNTAKGKKTREPFTVQLRKGDVYQVIGASAAKGQPADMTGSLVQATKPVAVFSGHNGAYIPLLEQGYNHLVEQLPPLSAWGRHYYVGTLLGRTRSTIRVVAADDDTKVFANGTPVAVLNAGEFYENSDVRENTQITGDKRILVAQYAHGFVNAADSVGDPMMILLTPTQQFLKRYRLATPIRGQWRHYLNIVAPLTAVQTMRLDGKSMDAKAFKPFGDSRYAITQIEVPYGTHTLEGAENFGLYSYGFGYGEDSYDAYGNMIGQSFLSLQAVKDTIQPMQEIVESIALKKGITTKLVIRDDREDDKGLETVRIVQNSGLVLTEPQVSRGAPQAEILINPAEQRTSGRALIEATDAAGNKALYTLCFGKDELGADDLITLTPGETDYCPKRTLNFVGLYGSFTSTWYDANFTSGAIGLANTPVYGQFAGSRGSGVLPTNIGLLAGHRFASWFAASARLSLESYAPAINAADTATPLPSLVRLLDGSVAPLQEGTSVRLAAPYIALTLAGEFYFTNNFYGILGIKAALATGKTLDVRRYIITPLEYEYQGDARERRLTTSPSENVQTLIASATGGFGVTVPVWRNIAAFGELTYAYPLSSVLGSGDWRIQQISLTLGARVRL